MPSRDADKIHAKQRKLCYDCNFPKQLWLRLENPEKTRGAKIAYYFKVFSVKSELQCQISIFYSNTNIQIVLHFDVQILKDFKNKKKWIKNWW